MLNKKIYVGNVGYVAIVEIHVVQLKYQEKDNKMKLSEEVE